MTIFNETIKPNGWTKVEDGLPKDGQDVLFFGLETDIRGVVYKKIFAGRYRIFKDIPQEMVFTNVQEDG